MIDIKLIRENKDLVKENIKKKFQDAKLPLVDEIYDLDIECRDCKVKVENLRALKNQKSSEIGLLMRDKKIDEANKLKEEISKYGNEIEELGARVVDLEAQIKEKMMIIPRSLRVFFLHLFRWHIYTAK